MDLSVPALRRSRLHPDVFRPPRTPASADNRLHIDSARSSSLTLSLKNSNGKRVRPTFTQTNLVTPVQTVEAPWSASSSMLRSDMVTPGPLVNSRYTLQGGVDTPTQEADAMLDSVGSNKDKDFRRRWSTGARHADGPRRSMASGRLGEQNGRGRSVTTSVLQTTPPKGWGSTVLNLVGSVAGRMWTFCNTTVFSGFQAGSGQQYKLRQDTQDSEQKQTVDLWEDEEVPRRNPTESWRSPSPMPGMWPENDVEEDSARCESPSKRPSKRIHTESGQGWVMVEMVAKTPRHRDSSPISKKASTTQLSAIPRPASRVTSRRSHQSHSRRSSAITPFAQTNPSQSPSISRKQNYLSPVSAHRTSFAINTEHSPASVEAQRYSARVKREEQQNDASLRRLNDRLSAMIKEGKEALGTKVEIVDGTQCEDEGYSEGIFG